MISFYVIIWTCYEQEGSQGICKGKNICSCDVFRAAETAAHMIPAEKSITLNKVMFFAPAHTAARIFYFPFCKKKKFSNNTFPKFSIVS